MNRPFVGISLAYMSGILTAKFLSIPYSYVWLGALCFLSLAVLLLIFRRKSTPAAEINNPLYKLVNNNTAPLIPIILSIFSIGILSHQIHSHVSPDNIANFITTKKEEVFLKGRVIKPVDRETAGDGRRRIVLTFGLEQVRFNKKGKNKKIWQNVSGRIIVYINGEDKSENRLRYGDELILKGLFSRPAEPSNPGQFDYSSYLKRRGISGQVMVTSTLDIVCVGRADYSKVLGWIYALRGRLESIIDESLDGTEAKLLKAMLLGQRQGISDELKDTFIRTGTVHTLPM